MYLPHSKVQQAPVFQGASLLSEESQETCQGDVLAGYLVASCCARCSALLAHCEEHSAAILLESHEGSYVSLESQVEMRRRPGVGRRVLQFRGGWGHSSPNPSQALYYDSQASQSYAGNVCKKCNLQTITAKPLTYFSQRKQYQSRETCLVPPFSSDKKQQNKKIISDSTLDPKESAVFKHKYSMTNMQEPLRILKTPVLRFLHL
jgi:hypothetical protein